MNRLFKTLMVAVLAAVGMAFAVQSAEALTVSTTAQTTTATISNLTLRDSALGNVLGNVTLTLTIGATSSSTFPVQVGRVTGGGATITSPAGVTARLTFSTSSWLVIVTGLAAGGGLNVNISNLNFQLTGVPGNPIYTGGSVSGVIGASPATTYVISSSGITSNLGTTGTFAVGSTFALSPGITYTVV